MTIGTNFIRGSNPVWYFVDLQGKQMDDTFWMWVLTDTIPYIPAPVYHDVSGTNPWTDPIQVLANGTLPIDIYWVEGMVYRLEFRQHIGLGPPTQADPLIYLVEDYVPNGAFVIPPSAASTITDNLISNGQFSDVNFSSTGFHLTSATNPAPIEIAPNWFLTLTGTGTVDVSQLPLNTTTPTPTNAPFAININTSGWSSAILSQRFYENGLNWQGKYVSTSLTAQMQGTPGQILVRLVASNGQPIAILMNPLLNSTFTEYMSSATNPAIPMYTNLNVPPAAYIDYQIILPSGNIYLTSAQLLVSASAGAFTYEQDTINRQQDNLFHYYNSKLQYKESPSYLVGWDFPYNPAQFNGDGTAGTTFATGINKGFYAWDQTIVYQSVDSSVGFSRAANGGFELTMALAGQVAIIQYLDAISANKIINDRASVRMSASTTRANGLAGNVTLWVTTDASVPSIGTGNHTLISTIGANGIPATVPGAWVQIPNVNQNTAFTLQAASATNSESADIILSGWDAKGVLPGSPVTYFAIVVGFSAASIADTITFNSIGLCAGDVPSRPSPKSPSETLLRCNEYYSSSFPPGTIPAQNVGVSTGPSEFNLVKATGSGNGVQAWFPVTMRVAPTVVTYNPAAANAQIRDLVVPGDFSSTTVGSSVTQKNAFISGTPNGASSVGNPCVVHWSADARFGYP